MKKLAALLFVCLTALVVALATPGLGSAAPPGRCTDFVHIFSLTGQDPRLWQARVTGTDLQRLVNDTNGHAFITIDDDDGSETLDIRWDDTGHPLNTVITLNGLNPTVFVSITNSTVRYTGCSQTYPLKYRRSCQPSARPGDVC